MQNPSTFQVYNASAGSGKTFTLVKEYLKILLETSDPKRFQHILAVTFTNKAAAEMKERVLSNLKQFSKESILTNKTELFLLIENELDLSSSVLHKRAEKVLHTILQNYGAFSITTIDSFTYRLIRNFAFDLGLSLNFDVEMDAKSIINEAVDLLISNIGEDKELTKILIDFSLQKTDNDKSWDISFELKEMAQILLNENDFKQVQEIQEKPLQDYLDLKDNLTGRQQYLRSELASIGTNGLAMIDNLSIDYTDFYYSQFPKHFKQLIHEPDALYFDVSKGLAKSIENSTFYTKGKAEEIKQAIDSIRDPLIALYDKSRQLFKEYSLYKLFLSNLIPLAVLGKIASALSLLKEEKNIRLNAEFNQLISENLREQPAPFIYERIGEKYKHYFIDEMQDTSLLQWQNLIPLISNALSQEHTSLLLVGDIKQAIYRWRGSEPEQFLMLSQDGNSKAHNPFFIEKKTELLKTNYRSHKEIIDFNNSFFQHISTFFSNSNYAAIYKNENQQKATSKQGGYVQLSFLEGGLRGVKKDEEYGEKVLQTINDLENNFDKNEICVLTRTRKQGVFLASYLTEKGVAVISSETLLLQGSQKIRFVIEILKYLQNKNDQEAKLNLLFFLHQFVTPGVTIHAFVCDHLELNPKNLFSSFEQWGVYFDSELFNGMSLYEGLEYIIRAFKLNSVSDAYLQFFLDEVLKFSQKKSNDIEEFLIFWEEKKTVLSIVVPEEKNAVRIMTIHKAKGLEFPVVIYPYDLDIYKERNAKEWYPIENEKGAISFNSLLVNNTKKLEETGAVGAKLYKSHQEKLELDNFNLIYVVLTRAIEQLYIISERKNSNLKLRSSSQFFINYLQSLGRWDETQVEFSFGENKRISSPSLKTKTSKELQGFISTSWREHNIDIVANSSVLWDTKKGLSISYGNLIHELMAQIKTADDIETAITKQLFLGTLDVAQSFVVKNRLVALVEHPDLKDYFAQNNIVFSERELYTDTGEILIPDRLVINERNEVVIIDYKTGKPEKKHQIQINNYGTIVDKLGYKVKKKLLVYIGESIHIDEV